MATASSSTDDEDRYPMSASPRGVCVIIINQKFSNPALKELHGSDKDKAALIKTFENLDFIVKCYDDQTKHEMFRIIQTEALDTTHSKYDCFVCCVSSHGDEGVVYGSDGVPVTIKDLTSLVRPDCCPKLFGKPKIFFIDACQGDRSQAGYRAHKSTTLNEDDLIPGDSDFFMGYATVPGYVSSIDENTGSVFIRHLTDCLDRLAHREELAHILYQVKRLVSREGEATDKQTAYVFNTLRYKIYFTTRAIQRFDPMSASPPSGVTIESRAGSDRQKPWITSLVVDHSSAFIFMTDFANNSIKVASLETGQLVSTLPLDVAPKRAVMIGEKKLVVTSDDKAIILVDITDKSELVARKKISTGRKYWDVCAVPSTGGDVTLVVGCDKDGDGPASVDVINVDGTCIKNIINSKKLPKLSQPRFLCVHDNHLYILDWGSQCVLKVDVNTGVVVDTLTHPDMRYPRQLCTDSAGHLYVASFLGECVLVRSVDGRWRKWLTGEEHGEREGRYVYPYGLSVSATGLVVSWLASGVGTVVKKYDLV